jgi:hypothetical protein
LSPQKKRWKKGQRISQKELGGTSKKASVRTLDPVPSPTQSKNRPMVPMKHLSAKRNLQPLITKERKGEINQINKRILYVPTAKAC